MHAYAHPPTQTHTHTHTHTHTNKHSYVHTRKTRPHTHRGTHTHTHTHTHSQLHTHIYTSPSLYSSYTLNVFCRLYIQRLLTPFISTCNTTLSSGVALASTRLTPSARPQTADSIKGQSAIDLRLTIFICFPRNDTTHSVPSAEFRQVRQVDDR